MNVAQYRKRWAALKSERSSWDGHWQELSQFLLPRAGRFQTTDRNRGGKKHGDIYDNTGTRALRILAAGLMSGMTSPARPWFRLTLPDEQKASSIVARNWLDDVATAMRQVFARTNLYRALHSQYEELALFGTGVVLIEPDAENLMRFHTLTAGEYALSSDFSGRVNTVYREFEMTASQMVGKFGLSQVSEPVRQSFNRQAFDQWFPVVQAITPRLERNPDKLDSKNMPFESCYFEPSSTEDNELSEGGFELIPALTPRWAVTGGDIYGSSPAMETLGDLKQLQHEQVRKAKGIDLSTDPPIVVPSNLSANKINRNPGGVTYADATTKDSIRPLYEGSLDMAHLLEDIRDVRERINASFYADLFLMLMQDTRSGITAREVAERHEEKLLMLGPVLERLQNELLEPLIEITFARMLKAGLIPPPPEELMDDEIKVEFVSTLAQAQRAVGVGAVDRLLGTVGGVAGFIPDIVDTVNVDKLISSYAEMLGVDPVILRTEEELKQLRADRAQQQQQAQMAEAAKASQPAANALKTASETDPTQGAAGSLGALMGYGNPTTPSGE